MVGVHQCLVLPAFCHFFACASRKTAVIGVSSMVSTAIALPLFAMGTRLGLGNTTITMDIAFNSFCALCSMKFGENLYQKIFGNCMKCVGKCKNKNTKRASKESSREETGVVSQVEVEIALAEEVASAERSDLDM